MLRGSLVLAFAALACLAPRAEAQSVAPLRLGAAIGTSFNRTSGSPYGGHGSVSVASQLPGSRFGLRLEALFEGGERLVPHQGVPGPGWQSNRTVALTINPTYRLWGRRTGLYAIAGLGIYQSWYEHRPVTQTMPTLRQSVFELGANAGLGFDFKAFGYEMWIETRLHSAAFHDRVPLTLGIRFEE